MSRMEASDWLRKNSKSDPIGPNDLKELWKEATTCSDEFKKFQEFSGQDASTYNWLLLPDWPFSEKEIELICHDAGLKPPIALQPPQIEQRNAAMQAALIGRLEKLKEKQSDTLRKGEEPSDVPEGFRRPVEAWISEPSRLAFAIAKKSVAFTASDLTAWEDFDLRVVQRARRMYDDRTKLIEKSVPAEILAAQGIDIAQKTGNERIRELAGLVEEPDRFDTALEFRRD